MHDKQRNAVLEDYKAGRIRCLVNRDILTTGFDDPKTDCIVMLRPTQSPGLWVQMLGRGTRPYPGKKDCLVLDFARNASVLGPIDNPTVPQAAKKIAGGQKRLRLILPVMKVCPKCQTYSPEGSATCSQCGFVFPIIPKHEKSADTLQLLSGTTGTPVVIKPNQWLTVGRMFAQKYTSRAGKDMMKVTYYCGKRTIADYVGFEHPGIMAYKARKWWQAHGGTYPLPRTYADALARLGELKTPHRIEVNFNTKVPEVVNYGFQPTPATGTEGSVDA
jgi:DNA repair protein RadD